MKIQKVALLGAGAVGSYVIWGLSRCPGVQFGVIAEGSRAERLRQGCAVNGEILRPIVWTPQEAQGADLLIVALKYGALPGALGSIRTAVTESTTVMSLMNGVDSEERIAAAVGAEHLLYSLIKIASCGVQTMGRKISPLTAQPWRRRSARLPSAMTPN